MKAVIPAAGLGTRFLPITKAIPKEMLPLGRHPVIHHVVAEAASVGFDEILIVLAKGKESIRDYFTPNPGMEERLARLGKSAELRALREVSSMAKISYAWQELPLGLGDAVRLAREFVGKEEVFAVLLGDTVMRDASPLARMLDAWHRFHLPSVCLEQCPEERAGRYGIAGGMEIGAGIFQLAELAEKPSPESAPRMISAAGERLPLHAFAARYLFLPAIFDFLDATSAGHAGEIQLTDAMISLASAHGLLGVTWSGGRLDIGNPAGLVGAQAHFPE